MRDLKLTILQRLIISYLTIIILVVGAGVYGIVNLNLLNRIIAHTIMDSRMIRIAEESSLTLYSEEAAAEKYLVSGDPDYKRQFLEVHAEFNKKMAEFLAGAQGERQKVLLHEIGILHGRYYALFAEKGALAGRKKSADSRSGSKLHSGDGISDKIDAKLRTLASISVSERDIKLQQSEEISTRVVSVFTITGFLALLAVILISISMTRTIISPIKLLLEKTKQIAKGDFGTPLQIVSPPEIKEFNDAFNLMCERLQELDQMKLDFISHLSHELRTPLTAIKEASCMLQEGIFAQAPEKQQELFLIIGEECSRLINSVNRILDFSRLEAGMTGFSFQSADITTILEKNLLKWSPLARRKKIDLRWDGAENLPAVMMDSEKMEEVVENLLSNALKFTPEEGRITMSAACIPGERVLRITIEDTGCGIPQEGLKDIFEKFRRIEAGMGTVRGTGLGLAIAKYIIDEHGGRIWVESEIGKGSSFIFTLPLS
ncbi:MAG: ATP-binding protein [Syntrophales bacterium]|jgi:two-component system sensor histidine kinase GlrK